TVTDGCNAITAEVTYTGGDTEAPQLAGVLPGGAVGNVCYADRPAAPLATDIALLYTDNCSTPTASLTSTDVTGDNCSWSVKYTYTVTAGCKAIPAEVPYTGEDTEAPQLAGVLPGGAVGNVCYADRPAAPLATDIALL